MTDQWDYDPPKVTWEPITDEAGTVVGHHIDPPFPDGDNLATLRHFAALIEHRTGLRVRVAESEDEDGLAYEVRTDHVAGLPAPFNSAWAWLSGYENGVYARRFIEEDTHG